MDYINGAGGLRALHDDMARNSLGFVDSKVTARRRDEGFNVGISAGPVLSSVDFSDAAGDVLATAGELADRLERPLVVVHVVHDPSASPGQYVDRENPSRLVPMLDVARRKLDELLARQVAARPELKCLRDAQLVLVEGLPSQRILEVAEREQAKMIVIGSQGRDGLSRVLNGSVAEAVARGSSIPVTIVKGV